MPRVSAPDVKVVERGQRPQRADGQRARPMTKSRLGCWW
jgi:hypothetical protein